MFTTYLLDFDNNRNPSERKTFKKKSHEGHIHAVVVENGIKLCPVYEIQVYSKRLRINAQQAASCSKEGTTIRYVLRQNLIISDRK